MTVAPSEATPAETAAKGAAALVGAVMHIEAPTTASAAQVKPVQPKAPPAKPGVVKPEAAKPEAVKTEAVAKTREPITAAAAADVAAPASRPLA